MTELEDYEAMLRAQHREWEHDQRKPWVKYIRVCLNGDHKALNVEITKLWIEALERDLDKIEPFIHDDENAEEAFMMLSEVYIRLVEGLAKRCARLNGQFVDKRRPGFFDPW
jgi:hypothetical protein